MRNKRFLKGFSLVLILALLVLSIGPAPDADSARREHETIGVGPATAPVSHTQHPDAQWYPDAAFGLFIHWGISSTRSMNISWPMIPGRPLAAKKIDDPNEQQRIIREGDWNLDGKQPAITPNVHGSGQLAVKLPANKRSSLVDVIKVEIEANR